MLLISGQYSRARLLTAKVPMPELPHSTIDAAVRYCGGLHSVAMPQLPYALAASDHAGVREPS